MIRRTLILPLSSFYCGLVDYSSVYDIDGSASSPSSGLEDEELQGIESIYQFIYASNTANTGQIIFGTRIMTYYQAYVRLLF